MTLGSDGLGTAAARTCLAVVFAGSICDSKLSYRLRITWTQVAGGHVKNLSAGNPGGTGRGRLTGRLLGILGIAALLLLFGAGTAAAAARRISCDQDAECERLRDEAQRLYEADKFQLALSALTSAYVIKPDPALLLNMGLTLLGLGRTQEALERCQQFELRVQKRTEQESELLSLCKQNAQRLEEEARLKAKQAEEASVKAAAETAAAELAAAEKEKAQRAQRERPLYKRAWFWGVLGGVVAAGVITGVTVGVVTSPAYRTPADLEVFQVQLRF